MAKRGEAQKNLSLVTTTKYQGTFQINTQVNNHVFRTVYVFLTRITTTRVEKLMTLPTRRIPMRILRFVAQMNPELRLNRYLESAHVSLCNQLAELAKEMRVARGWAAMAQKAVERTTITTWYAMLPEHRLEACPRHRLAVTLVLSARERVTAAIAQKAMTFMEMTSEERLVAVRKNRLADEAVAWSAMTLTQRAAKKATERLRAEARAAQRARAVAYAPPPSQVPRYPPITDYHKGGHSPFSGN